MEILAQTEYSQLAGTIVSGLSLGTIYALLPPRW